jgi:hypothetical protein
MRAPDSFEATADALNRTPGTRIACVGLQRDPQYAPGVEGVAEHQQLGFWVAPGALDRGREPGAADFRHGRDRVGPRRGAPWRPRGRPGPVVQVKEAGRADDGPAAQVVDRERKSPAGALVGERGLHVPRHRRVVGRDHGEGERVASLRRRPHKGADVAQAERLQPDAAAFQDQGWGHAPSRNSVTVATNHRASSSHG